jgi:hypothetical protein
MWGVTGITLLEERATGGDVMDLARHEVACRGGSGFRRLSIHMRPKLAL